ncbi:Transcriptional regulator CRZ1 [Zancudomyces culisetae]|uniref:Transcriptional regulator CRZ1 n=1 Tax=Zancudomyces culisetae TaxID=1213189 RepID=A0A1R1PV90_ZANCU|nr:Transcriptional regulator CRZ1 [Zancudomyces culisetae]|eukprot:OMH84849.1 Transcriptional regulator CRZ1 [Zancudomyces culisetae]
MFSLPKAPERGYYLHENARKEGIKFGFENGLGGCCAGQLGFAVTPLKKHGQVGCDQQEAVSRYTNICDQTPRNYFSSLPATFAANSLENIEDLTCMTPIGNNAFGCSNLDVDSVDRFELGVYGDILRSSATMNDLETPIHMPRGDIFVTRDTVSLPTQKCDSLYQQQPIVNMIDPSEILMTPYTLDARFKEFDVDATPLCAHSTKIPCENTLSVRLRDSMENIQDVQSTIKSVGMDVFLGLSPNNHAVDTDRVDNSNYFNNGLCTINELTDEQTALAPTGGAHLFADLDEINISALENDGAGDAVDSRLFGRAHTFMSDGVDTNDSQVSEASNKEEAEILSLVQPLLTEAKKDPLSRHGSHTSDAIFDVFSISQILKEAECTTLSRQSSAVNRLSVLTPIEGLQLPLSVNNNSSKPSSPQNNADPASNVFIDVQKDFLTSPVSSERKFICDVCSWPFARKHNMRTHRLTHFKDSPYSRPFECEVCSKKFTRKHDLKRHLKIH